MLFLRLSLASISIRTSIIVVRLDSPAQQTSPLTTVLHANPIPRNPLNFGKVPLLITKRTNRPRPQPPLNTIQVKNVSTISKGNAQPIIIRGRRVGLVFDGGFVERVSADGTVLGANIPGPHGNGIPIRKRGRDRRSMRNEG